MGAFIEKLTACKRCSTCCKSRHHYSIQCASRNGSSHSLTSSLRSISDNHIMSHATFIQTQTLCHSPHVACLELNCPTKSKCTELCRVSIMDRQAFTSPHRTHAATISHSWITACSYPKCMSLRECQLERGFQKSNNVAALPNTRQSLQLPGEDTPAWHIHLHGTAH